MPVLLDHIKKYPGCNRLLFGVNSNKPPAPILIKKMLLVLISANIINHDASVGVASDKSELGPPVVLKAVLGYSCRQEPNGVPTYAMFDDYYWFRVKVIQSN